jgi:hypothetical protein
MRHAEKISAQKLLLWVTDHPWLKLISLILAVLVWFYVRGEINRFNY